MSGSAWRSFCTLQELCEVARGITYGIVKVGNFVPGGVPVIRGGDIRGGRIEFDDAKRVTEEISRKFSRTILRGGEILLNLIAEPGHSAIAPSTLEGFNVSRDVAVIPVDSEANAQFVDFFLRSKAAIDWLSARLQGSVTQKINLRTLRELPVPIPPRPEQDAIAHILGTLDDKIELNRRMNETLEAMARALFKSWFIDFDPVCGDSRIRVEVAACNPSSESPRVGTIPTGWSLEPLDAVAGFRNGLALQRFRPQADEDRLPVVKIAQLRKGRSHADEWAQASITPECIIDDGDVVFSWSGSLLVRVWCGGQAALNQHLFKVTSERFPRWFYLHWVKHHLGGFVRIAADKATTMGHIRRRHLSEAICAVPPTSVLEAAHPLLSSLVERQVAGELESRTLEAVRDTLLPKLLSGQVRIADAEKFLGARA